MSGDGDGAGGLGGWGGGPRRFYERVALRRATTGAPDDAGLFEVTLDDKPLRCPGGAAFLAPRPVAEAAAAEWAAVAERVNPLLMPVTRAVNTSIERVPPQREAVIDEIAGYGASDLLCYRAGAPQELAAREAAAWDPLLDWAAARHGARLKVGVGIAPVAQEAEALAALRRAVAARSDLGLTALSELTSLTGSLVLALATAEAEIEAAAAWAASRIDETWQEERWGRDAEAAAAAATKEAAFQAAARLTALLRD